MTTLLYILNKIDILQDVEHAEKIPNFTAPQQPRTQEENVQTTKRKLITTTTTSNMETVTPRISKPGNAGFFIARCQLISSTTLLSTVHWTVAVYISQSRYHACATLFYSYEYWIEIKFIMNFEKNPKKWKVKRANSKTMTSMDNLLNVWFLTYYCVIFTRFNELYSKEKAARLDEIRVEYNNK